MRIAFSGVDSVYRPDSSYTITVTVNNPLQSRYGFELTALKADNDSAGELAIIDAATTSWQTQNGRDYIGHKAAATNNSWQFQWTAPDTCQGPITFYAAGNAANGDGSDNNLDSIYTEALTILPDTVGVTADFIVDKTSACKRDTLTFTDQSSAPSAVWRWDFGSGAQPSTAQGSGPHKVQYTSTGKKTVQLWVSNGCSTDTMQRVDYITVKGATADFSASADTILAGDTVTFNNNSTTADSFRWQLGGGNVLWTTKDTAVSNNYKYCDTTLTIALTAYKDNCKNTSKQNVSIQSVQGAFVLQPDTVSNFESVTFQNNSVRADTFVWVFGDGDTLVTLKDTPVTHTYGVPVPTSDFYVVDTSFEARLFASQAFCQDLSQRTVYLKDTITSGIKKPSSLAWGVYPNPASQYLILYRVPDRSSSFTLNIYDIQGQLHHSYQREQFSLPLRLRLPELEKGIYLLELTNGRQVWSGKKIYIK